MYRRAVESGASAMMNVWRVFNTIPAGKLNTKTILKRFRTGKNNANFLGHPYTCDGKQLQGNPAVCNVYVHIQIVRNGHFVLADPKWWKGP